jgi:hypothetical protein
VPEKGYRYVHPSAEGADIAFYMHSLNFVQAIVYQAASMMENKEINRLRHFRYAYIYRTSGVQHQKDEHSHAVVEGYGDGTVSVFAHPANLLRLSHFLMKVHAHSKKWTGDNMRPLVSLRRA